MSFSVSGVKVALHHSIGILETLIGLVAAQIEAQDKSDGNALNLILSKKDALLKELGEAIRSARQAGWSPQSDIVSSDKTLNELSIACEGLLQKLSAMDRYALRVAERRHSLLVQQLSAFSQRRVATHIYVPRARIGKKVDSAY